MARVVLNPRFKEISGRMKDVVLYTCYNRTLMRRYVVPRNPDTAHRTLESYERFTAHPPLFDAVTLCYQGLSVSTSFQSGFSRYSRPLRE